MVTPWDVVSGAKDLWTKSVICDYYPFIPHANVRVDSLAFETRASFRQIVLVKPFPSLSNGGGVCGGVA